MGRGLGRIQRQILDVIRSGEALSSYSIINHVEHLGISGEIETETNTSIYGTLFYCHEVKGWTDVEEMMWYVVNGPMCFRRADSNEDEDVYDPDFELKAPTEVDKQSIWRAIRQLEKRGMIESNRFPIHWGERMDRSSGYKVKQGGANKQKAIRLVQQSGFGELNA